MNHRKERMESLLCGEIARMLREELEFKDMLVTVTGVESDGDLDEAKVKISVLPSNRAEDALNIARPFARHFHGMLVRKLNLRPIPRLRFEIDHGPEKAAEVEKVFLESDTVAEE